MIALVANGAWSQDEAGSTGAGDGDIPVITDEVIVTGVPIGASPLETASDVGVLAGEAKFRFERASLGESLQALAGVDNISAGSPVGVPVVRGLSGTRTRILSNEIGLDYQQYGVRHPPECRSVPGGPNRSRARRVQHSVRVGRHRWGHQPDFEASAVRRTG